LKKKSRPGTEIFVIEDSPRRLKDPDGAFLNGRLKKRFFLQEIAEAR